MAGEHTPRTRSEISERIDDLAAKLDDLTRGIYAAYDGLDAAEVVWLPLHDDVAETLREEGLEQGRKSDPAEHTVLAAARKKYPVEYQVWRRAKREVARLEQIAHNRRSEISGLQTKLRESGDEKQPAPRAVGQRTRPRAAA